jgi:hypothetical protein
MLLIDGVIGAVVLRHLVFLPVCLVRSIALLADVLLIDGMIGAVVLRHLVFLPVRLVRRVAAFPYMLLVDGPADGVFLHDVVILVDWAAYRVAVCAIVLLVDGTVTYGATFAHDRTVDRTTTDAGAILVNGFVADPILNRR